MLIEWFREYKYPVIFGVLVLVGLSSFGIGLWLGLDSQEARVKKLEEENRVLAETLSDGAILMNILNLRLENLIHIIQHFVETTEKERDYNEGALE